MIRIVGSEVSAYRGVAAPTGVPRVVKETHRYLAPGLAAHHCTLVPLITRPEQLTPSPSALAYPVGDPLLEMSLVMPEQVDAVLLLDPMAPIDFGRLLKARRQRGLLVFAMLYDLLPIEHPEWFLAESDRHYRVLLQQILHVADHIIIPSESVRQSLDALRWRIRPKIHTVPLGSPFTQLPPARASLDQLDLVYVSTVEPRKGHAQLLDSFDLLRARRINVCLTLIGRIGWESDGLVSRIQGHPELGSSLQWIRFADDDVVRFILQRGAVAVMPTEGEGFGLFLEEALTAGVNVVVSDLGVLRERRYPNVFFVENSPEALAAGILEAACCEPVSLAPGTVRSMADFSHEVQDVILSYLVT